MKILHFTYDDTKNPWCGGGGAYRVKIVNEYLGLTNRITVVTGNYPGAKDETVQSVTYRHIGLRSPYLLSRISFTILAPFYVKEPYDLLVNDFSAYSPFFADLRTKKPVIDIVHHLVQKHAARIYPIVGYLPFLFEKLLLKTTHNIITPSQAIREKIKGSYANKNVIDIPNGVSEELFRLVPEERDFILFLGRIDAYMKGLDILIEAFSKIHNRGVSLKIAGSGKERDARRIRSLIGEYGLEGRMELLGRVSEREKLELLKNCLFLVMPSRFEGWGITAVEANAACKPVLATAIPGLSEAVLDRKTAVLVQPEDADSLSAGIDFLVEDGHMRRSLGEAGREWARKFSWKAIAARQLDFYRAVLAGKIRLGMNTGDKKAGQEARLL